MSKPKDPADAARGVSGELWAVHGGGFYCSQKFPLGPAGEPLSDNLHWSKWEAYSTWLSGMGLMAILYWHGANVYLVPRVDGEIVVGGTVEDRGFDSTVTAGAVHELLRDACAVVPEIAECALVEVHAGFRPGSPDNAPIIGQTAVDGLIVATGHYRNGVLLTPVTAEIVAAMLVTAGAAV